MECVLCCVMLCVVCQLIELCCWRACMLCSSVLHVLYCFVFLNGVFDESCFVLCVYSLHCIVLDGVYVLLCCLLCMFIELCF